MYCSNQTEMGSFFSFLFNKYDIKKCDFMSDSDNLQSNSKIDKERNYFY